MTYSVKRGVLICR